MKTTTDDRCVWMAFYRVTGYATKKRFDLHMKNIWAKKLTYFLLRLEHVAVMENLNTKIRE